MLDGLINFIVSTLALIPFILTLRKAILRCSPESRTLSPAQIWLLIIPFFNFVWEFVVVVRLAETLHNEFSKRGIETDKAPGRTIGLVTCALFVIAIIPFRFFDLIVIAGLPATICWVMYWIKIWRFSSRLRVSEQSAQPGAQTVTGR